MKIEWKIAEAPVAYPEAVAFMEARVEAIRAGKANPLIWLVEHPPLYTAGTSAKSDDLKDPDRFPVFETGRGGQFTYHGPGQRVVYVMLDLKQSIPNASDQGPDVRRFVHFLESWLINVLQHDELEGKIYPDRVGVWVDMPDGTESKIAAIGIRVRQWVTFHGMALNVDPDLSHFSGIVPCGISEHGVTSLKALGKNAEMTRIDALLKEEFEKLTGITCEVSRPSQP